MFAQFRMAWPRNWNALLQSRGDINTGVDPSVTEVLPQFATGATHSRSGESLSAALRFAAAGLRRFTLAGESIGHDNRAARPSTVPCTALPAPCTQRYFCVRHCSCRRCDRNSRSGSGELQIRILGPAFWAPHKRVAHNPKTAERASKEPSPTFRKARCRFSFRSISRRCTSTATACTSPIRQ